MEPLTNEEQTITPVQDEHGAVTHFIAIKQDITERKRAGEELRQSEQKFRNLIESLPTGIALSTPKGGAIEANPAILRMTGYQSKEEFLQVPASAHYHIPEDRERFAKQLVEKGAVSGFETQIKRKDGSIFWGSVTSVAQIAPDGTVLFINSLEDITERKQAEAALHESDRMRRLVLDNVDEIVYFVEMDAGNMLSSQVRFVSGRVEKILGYQPEEFIRDREFWFSSIHPDDVPVLAESTRAILASGESGMREYRMRHRRTGDYHWIEDHVVPELDSVGVVIGQFGVARDSTDRKRRERELGAIAVVSAALRTAPTHAEMPPVILAQLLNLLKADGALLAMRDPASGETIIELGHGAAGQNFTGVRLPPGAGVTGHVIATGQPYLNNDVQRDPRFARPDLLRDNIGAVACVPLNVQEQTIGALCLLHVRDITADEIRVLTAIADIAANAIRRATLHEQTERRLRRLAALRTVDMAISSSVDLHLTMSILLDQSTTHLRVDAADILLFNRYAHTLDYAAGRGFRGDGITRSHLRLGECQAGRAALERRSAYVANLAEETTFVRSGLLANENFVAHYVTPLIAKGEVKGVLEVFHRAPLDADPEWLDFLEALAGQAAIAIDDAELFNGLQRSNTELELAYDATIEGWSRALDLRDRETEGHTRRVTEVTERLARALGLSEAELVHIRRGALLHDIGKMGVLDAILLKPGPLTDEEWVSMRRHPQFAHDMLAPITYLRPALDIPYCHHEKWDGTGYPRGLKGEQIPLAARIFSVVDVWDALRSDRPYRNAWPEEKVAEYIREQAGKHFDPQVVEAFLAMTSDE